MGDYYDVLGVEPDAGSEELRRAYHRRAQQLHPDRFEAAPERERRSAEAQMKALNEAWATLKNAESRRRYDIQLGVAEPDPADVELWDRREDYPVRRSFFHRTGVQVAVVGLIVLAFVASAAAALISAVGSGSGGDRGPASWSPAAEAELRTAAVNAGFTFTEADCFVEYVTSRYSPDDSVGVSVVEEAAGACR